MSDELEILLYGHPDLRERCAPVEQFDADLRELVDGMVHAMAKDGGIGLAAPQVGDLRRLLIARDDRGRMPRIMVLVNPEIVSNSNERDSFNEGCLSLPGITADVVRPVRVELNYLDLDGNEHMLSDDGLLSRIVQHELDHLEGILFVDHLPLLRRKLLAKKLKALARQSRVA